MQEKKELTIAEKKKLLKSFSIIDSRVKLLSTEIDNELCNAAASTLSYADQLKIMLDELESERNKLYSLQARIIKAISELNDLRERQVLYLKYIGMDKGKGHRQLKLWQIAKEMNYSEDRVKRFHTAGLLHIKL